MSELRLTRRGPTMDRSRIAAASPDQRDAILRAAVAKAEADYRDHPELTAFEAFGDSIPSASHEIQP